MKRKCFGMFWIVIMSVLFLAGCRRERALDPDSDYICYVNADATGLVKEEYEIGDGTTEEKVRNMLRALQENPDSIDYNSAYPDGVRINGWELKDSDLDIDFAKSYRDLSSEEELLLRAATVQSLNQIGGVDYIKFTIDGEELKDREGNEVGYMSQDIFVDNTGSSLHSYQDGKFKLFFANKTGDKLVKKEISIRYNSNKSAEKLIVEQLLKGPSMEGAYPTIAPQTKILGVSVRDGICYVNFDEAFLAPTYNVSPQVAIYSLVNSIVEGGGASQVQILINGETTARYQESVSLETPFERNLEIVEEGRD